MAKEKLRFYLAMDQEAPKNAEKFQQTIILLECEERWKGAAKRFFRKADFGYLNRYVDELPVYG